MDIILIAVCAILYGAKDWQQVEKWMNFYTKVLAKLVGKGLTLRVRVEYRADSGISTQRIEEVKLTLRELGLRPLWTFP